MRFEITRLDDDPEISAEHRTVVDTATVRQIIDQAALTGDRLYIRPHTAG
jgi:hypothetical protein